MNKRIKKKIRRRDNIRSWKRFKDIELITNTVTPEFIAKVYGIPAEGPVVISRSAADRLSAPMIRKVEIRINDNDIPLNLYGDR